MLYSNDSLWLIIMSFERRKRRNNKTNPFSINFIRYMLCFVLSLAVCDSRACLLCSHSITYIDIMTTLNTHHSTHPLLSSRFFLLWKLSKACVRMRAERWEIYIRLLFFLIFPGSFVWGQKFLPVPLGKRRKLSELFIKESFVHFLSIFNYYLDIQQRNFETLYLQLRQIMLLIISTKALEKSISFKILLKILRRNSTHERFR